MEPSTEKLQSICNMTNLTEDCINSSAITSLHTLYALGSAYSNDQCTVDALPFFCDAIHFLCSESEVSNLTSTCLTVRDNYCALEWRVEETFLNTPLPNCASFGINNNLTFTKAPLPNCPDQFATFCDSICLPLCGEYSPYGRGNSLYYIFLYMCGIIGVIGGVVTLIACYYNRHKM